MPPWSFRRVVLRFQRDSGCSHVEDGLELAEGVGEGSELGDGESIPDIRMLEVRLVALRTEAFSGGAVFEALLELLGLSVEDDPELVGIVEIDGFGASPFGVDLEMAARPGDGIFLSVGVGVRTLISSSVVSFGLIEPCRLGFPFLSPGSDDAAVGAELGGFGVVSSGVAGDVGLSMLGIVFLSEDVLIAVPGIEGGVCEQALDEEVRVLSGGVQPGECEVHVGGVGRVGGFSATDFDAEVGVFLREDGGFPSPEVSDFLFARGAVFFMGGVDSESCGRRGVGDVFFVAAVFAVVLGIVFLDRRVDFGRIAGDISGKDAEGFEGADGLQEESVGAILFARPKFLGDLLRGEDGAVGIKAVLGGVSFQDKAHRGSQRGTFAEEGSQVGNAVEGFVELDQLGFEVYLVGVFAFFGASFVGIGGRCDVVYELEEGSIALDGGVLVEGLEEGVFEVGCSAWGIGGLARRCGARGEGVRSPQVGSFSEEVLEGEGVRQHPC